MEVEAEIAAVEVKPKGKGKAAPAPKSPKATKKVAAAKKTVVAEVTKPRSTKGDD